MIGKQNNDVHWQLPLPCLDNTCSAEKPGTGDSEIAWAAGLFEGEGLISLDSRGARSDRSRRLTLVMSDQDTVARFARAVGCGNLRERAPQEQSLKPLWQWRTGASSDIAYVFTAFWPWLAGRRRAKALELVQDPCWRRHPLPDPSLLAYDIAMPADPPCRTAWAAGLYEAEGWFGLSNHGRTARMVLATTDLDVLKAFAGVVGCGYCREGRTGRYGKRRVWYWQLNHAGDVQRVIRGFLPWLGERRAAKALEVLRVAENVPITGRNRSVHRPRTVDAKLVVADGEDLAANSTDA